MTKSGISAFAVAALVVCGGSAFSLSAGTAAFGRVDAHGPSDAGLPNFDIRVSPDGTPDAAVRDALSKHPPSKESLETAAALRTRIANLTIDRDFILGTPRLVQSWSQYLTDERSNVSPAAVIQRFLLDNAALFEIDPTEIDGARITRNFRDEHNGVTHLTYQQQSGGVDLFDAGIKANVGPRGQLVNISSTMLPRPRGGFVAAEPKLTELEAIRAAAANVGVKVTVDPTPAEDGRGASRKRRWNNSPDFRADQAITSELVLFPLTRDELRPAWFVVIPTRGVGHTYEMIVDAIDGRVLYRVNELCFESLRAYTTHSPVPVFGAPFASRSLVMAPASTTGSPFGWWDTNGVAGPDFTNTRGNNVDAHLDRNADNIADVSPPRPSGGPSLIFDPLLDVTAQPTAWGDASVVQAFYLANVYHDRLYTLGFTEVAGNFQTNNYGLGGTGNDAIQMDCQDGSSTNNANFATPADGNPGRCQMFIWTYTSPNRDSGLDADVLFHELTHGLSNRLTGGPANGAALTAVQSAGMGEGWSDFVALCLISGSGDDPNGSSAFGTYLTGTAAGIRRFPYSTNIVINPLLWDAFGTSGITPYGVTRSTEVHNTGEIWCQCLWDCRSALYQTQGFAANDLMLRLAVDGMKLQPANPTVLQARDAIIAADLALTGGANGYALWTSFARRGLGAAATTVSSNASSVTTAFDVPEGSDAGELPASAAVVSGIGAVTRLSGSLTTGNVDMYRINICDRTAFSATTVGLSSINTQLFLFDSNGRGVKFNDDASSTVQSTLTAASIPANGEYFLAISGADRDPRSAAGAIWLDLPTTTERVPDGPGATQPITTWNGTDSTSGGTYVIQLTGTCGSTFGAVPVEPRPLAAFGSPSPAVIGPGGGSVQFSVYVTPGTVPASTGVTVTINASSIGLGSISLSGGPTYTATRIVGVLPAGNYDLPCHVTDAQGRVFDGSVLLTVVDPVGTCCLPSGACTIVLNSQCLAQSGQFAGSFITCDVLPCSARAEVEPDNTPATASDATQSYHTLPGNRLHLGLSGVLSSTSDIDYFNIGALAVGDVLTASESGTPSSRGSLSDPLVHLYRAGAAGVVIEDDDSGPGVDSLIWRYTVSTADTYYLRADRFSSATGSSYQLGLWLEKAGALPATGGTLTAETEPNESTAAATNVATSWRAVQYLSTVSGSITAGDVDLFAHHFIAGDLVSLNVLAGTLLNARVSLLNSAGTVIASDDGTSIGPGNNSPVFAYVIPTTGTYYVNVAAASGTGNYFVALYLSTTTPPPICAPDFNNSGLLSVQDIFDFLAAYFGSDPRADFNNSGIISVQDIFDFLAAYFAGC